MIDELLARLEAGTLKLDGGRGGGIPELTPQDIAAALGMCENKAASVVFHAVAAGSFHWPDVDRVLASIQVEEWKKRADRLIDAQLAQVAAEFTKGSAERSAAQTRAASMMTGAKLALWPALTEGRYEALRRALIAELRHNRICPVCNGRKSVVTDTVVVECGNCAATGRVSVSDTQRALSIGLKPPHGVKTYQRVWRQVYEWMYIKINDLVSVGRDQFKEALGRSK